MAAKPAKEVWVVTWTPSTASAIGGGIVPSKPERKIFGDQKTAVSFVMNKLDERFRGTARLIFRDGHAAEFPVIEQMYAEYRKGK
jgi:hypothetical protein